VCVCVCVCVVSYSPSIATINGGSSQNTLGGERRVG